MGAKQSKRSVDISGKEAEGAGEAVAGAGEGRVEQLADVDNLKPQLNGDAHITPPEETTEKEKQLDSGTPENEKDATTEKESKDKPEKEATPVANGESETKPEADKENGEATPTTKEGKKSKKEKIKKKFSLRSISFSRKDKPKQEKKQKEEEPKTNGEQEKVAEETVEAATEAVKDATTPNDAKPEAEAKDDKTPETPVTEPITNGSNTPETPKTEAPEVAVEKTEPSSEKPEVTPVEIPEQLPINGLSLDDKKEETPAVVPVTEEKTEETIAEVTDKVPASEIPVKTEVCVEQVPLVESSPPPLPVNPPPSSVASFAATTMAPELTDTPLANNADVEVAAPPVNTNNSEAQSIETVENAPSTEITAPIEIAAEENVIVEPLESDVNEIVNVAPTEVEQEIETDKSTSKTEQSMSLTESPDIETTEEFEEKIDPIIPDVPAISDDSQVDEVIENGVENEDMNNHVTEEEKTATSEINGTESHIVSGMNGDCEVNGLHDEKVNGNATESDEEILKNNVINSLEKSECNGNMDHDESTENKSDKVTNVTSEIIEECVKGVSPLADEDWLPPPADIQDPLPSHDKIVDLIPEMPDLPTETETVSDVAVVN